MPAHMLQKLKDEICALLKKQSIAAERLEQPPLGIDADFSFPCFPLAKQFKKSSQQAGKLLGAPEPPKSPVEIAKDVAGKIKLPKKSLVKKVDASGPYINFYADWAAIGDSILSGINAKYGESKIGKNEKVMVEFSEPNPNKPMHIGHARNTFLGDSLARIMSAAGYDVMRANYYNNSGIHIAKTVLAYIKWGHENPSDFQAFQSFAPQISSGGASTFESGGKSPKETGKIMPSADGKLLGTPSPKKPDHFIGALYEKFNSEAAKNPELEKEAREILKKIEAGDKETLAVWKKTVGWCIDGFNETYKRLDIKFDVIFFESDFEKAGREVVRKAIQKSIAFKDKDGEIVANLKPYNIPNCIILRSDGTTLYATKDLALAAHKFDKYKVKKSIYVVGAEQEQYLAQIFKILALLGYENAKNMHHLKYGLVMLPEGKMSSRKGLVVLMDTMADELKEHVAEIIEKSHPDIKNAALVSEKVGIGALKFALIKTSPEKTILFSKEEVTQFDGDTGPYLQYAYARASSILRQGKLREKFDVALLKEPDEIALLKKIAQFPEVVTRAAETYQPHLVATYLLELTHAFNTFYQKVPVLKAETDELKNARLHLVFGVRQVIGNGLALLGIEALEEM